MIENSRYHDISMGHRVYGHESKCAHLHGHNYRFHFTIRPKDGLDNIGRVIDFSVIKKRLVEWLETEWDHKMMLWDRDPFVEFSHKGEYWAIESNSIVVVPFNPTAENIAKYFTEIVAPKLFANDEVYLYSLKIDETAKCSATFTLEPDQESYMKQARRQPQPANMPSTHYCSRATNGQVCLCNGKSAEQLLECYHCHDELPF